MQLMERLYEQEVSIIVPTLCIAEFLVAYEPNEQNGIRAAIEQDFKLVVFDNLSAVQAARVYRINRDNGRHKEFKARNVGYPHQKLKVDHMIVGVAIANKVDMLYTNDSGLFNFAQTHIPVLMLPESGPRQLVLN